MLQRSGAIAETWAFDSKVLVKDNHNQIHPIMKKWYKGPEEKRNKLISCSTPCHLIGTKPLPEPIMTYCSLDLLSNTYYVAPKQTSKLFITCKYHYHVSPCSKFDTGNGLPPDRCKAITWTKADCLWTFFFKKLKLYLNQLDRRLL